jgi:hypothetical protein
MTTTAWGSAKVVEEVSIAQIAKYEGDQKSFTTLVQLLEGEDGESLVRFAYSTGNAARRGPVTLRAQDIHKLRKALAKAPRLRAALAWT